MAIMFLYLSILLRFQLFVWVGFPIGLVADLILHPAENAAEVSQELGVDRLG